MRGLLRIALHPLLIAGFLRPAGAHFNMLLPRAACASQGEKVTVTYQWGHPFEHQLFNAPEPERLIAVSPDGKEADLRKALEKIAIPVAGDKVAAYRLSFRP